MHMGKQTFLSLTVAVALGAAATGVVTTQTGGDPPRWMRRERKSMKAAGNMRRALRPGL